MSLRNKAILALAALSLVLSTASVAAQDKPWFKAPAGPAYQVLIYSFADSNGDGYGDIKGLTQHLDYLNDGKPGGTDLGVSAIWLSPVHPSPSYHGYDVVDYLAIDPKLGTMDDFATLCKEAHKRGIKIIMDMVFNHTALGNPWFARYRAGQAPYDKYYEPKDPSVTYGTSGQGGFWTFPKLDGTQGTYFGAFGQGMPDLNPDNTDVMNEFRNILKFWMDKGADGFRFDAAKHIYDTNERPVGDPILQLNRAFFSTLRKYARSINPNVFFVGEVMTTSNAELAAFGYSLDSVFDFAGEPVILNAAKAGTNNGFAEAWAKNLSFYSKIKGFYPSPILSNHDQDRSMTIFLQRSATDPVRGWGPDPADDAGTAAAKLAALQRAKIAASIYLTLPGLPFIYYGEELGMTGRRYFNDDVDRRFAFPWTVDRKASPNVTWMLGKANVEPDENVDTPAVATQLADSASLLEHYVRLNQARASIPALQDGDYAVPTLDDSYNIPSILFYGRSDAAQSLLVVHNVGADEQSPDVPAGMSLTLLWDSSKGLAAKKATLSAGASYKIASGQSMIFEIGK